jgi:hypothetical protein
MHAISQSVGPQSHLVAGGAARENDVEVVVKTKFVTQQHVPPQLLCLSVVLPHVHLYGGQPRHEWQVHVSWTSAYNYVSHYRPID